MRRMTLALVLLPIWLANVGAYLEGAEASPHTSYWPQFRGPNASGVADGAKPPVQISPTENVLWKIDVPWSPSSPVVWQDRILLTTVDQGELQTRCYQRADGRLLWTRGIRPEQFERFHSTDGSPAASTPVCDGQRVVSYFGSAGLFCYDLNGNEQWRYPMPIVRTPGDFGTGTSPILVDGKVVLLREELTTSKLIALDASTGTLRWEAPRPAATGSYATPILWKNQGIFEIVTAGAVQLRGYALETGEERWVVNGLSSFVCTTPVVGDEQLYFAAWCPGGEDSPWPAYADFLASRDKDGDGQVSLEHDFTDLDRDYFRSSDVDEDGVISPDDWNAMKEYFSRGVNQLVAVNPGGQGDITNTHVPWSVLRGLPYVASPLFYEGRVYLIRDGGLLTCVDATTGAPHYTQRRIPATGSYYASPVAADGRIYLASMQGELSVVQAGGNQPRLLHQSDFGERIVSTPALVENQLYLRTETSLYAFSRQAE